MVRQVAAHDRLFCRWEILTCAEKFQPHSQSQSEEDVCHSLKIFRARLVEEHRE